MRHNPNERDGEPGVVCGVFHAGPSPLPLRKRLGEIVAWQRIYVLPGSRGRAFRRAVTPQREEPWEDPPSLEPLLDPELDWY